jgi:hypothetical protein
VSGAIFGSDFGQNEQLLLQTSIMLNSIQLGIGKPLYVDNISSTITVLLLMFNAIVLNNGFVLFTFSSITSL